MSNYERELKFCDKMGINTLDEIFDFSPDDVTKAIMAEDYITRYFLIKRVIQMAGEF